MEHEHYMREALSLAEKGAGHVSPNPMVGAVIVKDGEIIGRGYHEHCGGLHAERNALKSCVRSPEGASMYVTLEPCCHYGKQPPCTDAILESGIKEVFVGSGDPNPLVAGGGITKLRENGIAVTENILKNECDRINEVFFHYIKTKTPYTVLKYAMSLDGKIADCTGNSKWITGEAARADVHKRRNRYSAVMVGVGTVKADNPRLTCRAAGGRNPIRIICDTHLRTPLDAYVVKTASEIPTIIASCVSGADRIKPYTDVGVTVMTTPKRDGHVDLSALMTALGERGIDSVMIEGGAQIAFSALEAGIVNKILAYIAPRIIGGENAKAPVGGRGFALMSSALRLTSCAVTQIGDDFLIESSVV